jgi:hypothetical protein
MSNYENVNWLKELIRKSEKLRREIFQKLLTKNLLPY